MSWCGNRKRGGGGRENGEGVDTCIAHRLKTSRGGGRVNGMVRIG